MILLDLTGGGRVSCIQRFLISRLSDFKGWVFQCTRMKFCGGSRTSNAASSGQLFKPKCDIWLKSSLRSGAPASYNQREKLVNTGGRKASIAMGAGWWKTISWEFILRFHACQMLVDLSKSTSKLASSCQTNLFTSKSRIFLNFILPHVKLARKKLETAACCLKGKQSSAAGQAGKHSSRKRLINEWFIQFSKQWIT